MAQLWYEFQIAIAVHTKYNKLDDEIAFHKILLYINPL